MATMQEMMQEMNEKPPGLETPAQQPQAPSTPQNNQQPTTPAAPTTPAQPTDPKQPESKQEPAKSGETKTQTPDPKGQAQNTATPTEPKQGETPPAPAAEVEETAFYGRLSKMTDGALKSEQDFAGMIHHYNQLLEEKEQGFQPKFKDERAKKVYQMMVENQGQETQAMMRTLRAIDFKADGKSPKDVLFEAYLLDPKNSDLGPIEAQKYFEAEYDHSYSDAENNPIIQRKLALAVREANERIGKIQQDFLAPQEQQQQQVQQISEEVERGIFDAVDNFGGVKLAFTDNPQENDYLNMAADDVQELEAMKKDLMTPNEWWNSFVNQFATEKGFDYSSLAREFWEMRNHAKKAELAFQHGKKLGMLEQINTARNASDPKQVAQLGQPGAAPAGPKSLEEAWAMAKTG